MELAFFSSSIHTVLIISIFVKFLYKQNTESSGTLTSPVSLKDQADSVKLPLYINAV